jgi:hypothetical protein
MLLMLRYCLRTSSCNIFLYFPSIFPELCSYNTLRFAVTSFIFATNTPMITLFSDVSPFYRETQSFLRGGRTSCIRSGAIFCALGWSVSKGRLLRERRLSGHRYQLQFWILFWKQCNFTPFVDCMKAIIRNSGRNTWLADHPVCVYVCRVIIAPAISVLCNYRSQLPSLAVISVLWRHVPTSEPVDAVHYFLRAICDHLGYKV